MDITLKSVISTVVDNLLETNSYKAEKYLTDKLVVRATRKSYKGKFAKGNIEILLVVGKPNFAQREFIKDCKKAGEPFPVKRIQLKALPKKNGKRK